MSKPKEFKIFGEMGDDGKFRDFIVPVNNEEVPKEELSVVEKSAYDELKAENEQLERALKIADRDNAAEESMLRAENNRLEKALERVKGASDLFDVLVIASGALAKCQNVEAELGKNLTNKTCGFCELPCGNNWCVTKQDSDK